MYGSMLQSDIELKEKFKNVSLLKFYKKLSTQKQIFPAPQSLFGNVNLHIREAIFKNKIHSKQNYKLNYIRKKKNNVSNIKKLFFISYIHFLKYILFQ